jgi:hypothetical protein
MRRLIQPEVIKSAGLAAGTTALVCYPRFALWRAPYPIWYLELVLLLGGFVLWAFVFAWHTPFTGRPVFRFPVGRRNFASATIAGLLVAAVLHWFLDSTFRLRTPGDYPTSFDQWIGMTLFALAFHPLFLTFAPLAWALRLFRRLWIAIALTVLFGVFVLIVKAQSAPTPLPSTVFMELLVLRIALGSLAIFFYLRGGVLLVWWWSFLLQLRHLLTL